MANLHVQPKKNSNAWLWIILLIIIIAAAAYYFLVYKKQPPANNGAFQQNNSLQLKTAQFPLQPVADAATILY